MNVTCNILNINCHRDQIDCNKQLVVSKRSSKKFTSSIQIVGILSVDLERIFPISTFQVQLNLSNLDISFPTEIKYWELMNGRTECTQLLAIIPTIWDANVGGFQTK